MMQRDCAIPVLPCRNLEETIAFYKAFGFESGFENNFENDFENPTDYAILYRGSIELHFVLFPEIVPAESYASCYLRVTNVDVWFESFQGRSLPNRGIPRIGSLEDKPWGMREFYIVDPSGNLLKIGQVIA